MLFKKILSNASVISCLAALMSFLMRFAYKTTKWQKIGIDIVDGYIKEQKPVLIALWHDKLMVAPCAWEWEKPLYVLASKHRDGMLISSIVSKFNMKTVYGSTGKCSVSALKDLIRLCETNCCLAIIPDGPRGPRHTVAPGIISIAKSTKTDIIPFTFCVKRYKKLKSWDQFVLSYPFNKGIIACGEPIKHSELDNISQDEGCELLQKRLNDLFSSIKDGPC